MFGQLLQPKALAASGANAEPAVLNETVQAGEYSSAISAVASAQSCPGSPCLCRVLRFCTLPVFPLPPCIPTLSLYSHTLPVSPHVPCIPARSLYSRTLPLFPLLPCIPARSLYSYPFPQRGRARSVPAQGSVAVRGGRASRVRAVPHGHSVSEQRSPRRPAAAMPRRRADRFLLRPGPAGEAQGECLAA